MNDVYLRKQIITYMGNKRKFISIIGQIIDDIKTELNADNLVLADGFSGSGIISRLLKVKGDSLYVNDIAGYSETLNKCYLSSPSPQRQKKINTLMKVNIYYIILSIQFTIKCISIKYNSNN